LYMINDCLLPSDAEDQLCVNCLVFCKLYVWMNCERVILLTVVSINQSVYSHSIVLGDLIVMS